MLKSENVCLEWINGTKKNGVYRVSFCINFSGDEMLVAVAVAAVVVVPGGAILGVEAIL